MKYMTINCIFSAASAAVPTSASFLAFGNADFQHLQARNETNATTGTLATVTLGNYPGCNYAAAFANLDELQHAVDTGNTLGPWRSDCIAAQALKTLINMLHKAHDQYQKVNDGYDQEFDYYVKYMNNLIPEVIQNEMMFDTSDWPDDQSFPPLGPGMKFFDCKLEGDEDTGGGTYPCNEIRSGNHIRVSPTTTNMTLKDKDGFHAALLKLGIQPDWVHFGDHSFGGKVQTDPLDHEPTADGYSFSGFPIKKDDITIPDPKTIAVKVVPRIPQLIADMEATLYDITFSQYQNGSLTDPAVAYSSPVLMLLQAVDNMEQAKKIGETEEKQEREQLIMLIVSTVLAVVPFIGEEAATAAGFATVARTIFIAGEAANGVLALYDTYKHPEDALLNLFGIVMGVAGAPKALRNGAGLSKVAKARNSIKDDIFKAAGPIVNGGKKRVDNLVSTKYCKFLK